MGKVEIVREWLNRAKSSLAKAKVGKGNADICLEDLCFDAQQSIEKLLKSFLVFLDVDFPKIHSIGKLITLLMQSGVAVPNEIKESAAASYYAVTTRYPGDWELIADEDYVWVVNMAERVFCWVESELKKQGFKEN